MSEIESELREKVKFLSLKTRAVFLVARHKIKLT